MHVKRGLSRRGRAVISAAASVALCAASPALAADRLYGVDVSDWQQEDSAGNQLAPINWTLVHAPITAGGGGKDFAFIRSSRGGTTGTYNKYDGTGTLSQKYDDYRFVENITNATAAGVFSGPYHFTKADIASNTGTDEADHFIQAAGAWMKPGYLLPTDDLESGDALRSTADLSQFHVDFANRILAVKGIRPLVYIGQNYSVNEVDSTVPAAMPNRWIARWPNQTYPEMIDVQNWDPIPSPVTANVYGVWNAQYPQVSWPEPWQFWQYNSRGKNIPGLLGDANGNTDLDVSHGGMEYLKDFLVPALWTTDTSGDWSDITKWNSDNPAYVAGNPATGPSPRLPGQNGMTLGSNDTVILERTSANPTITLSSGAYNIRKLIVKEQLNITGGSLTVNYVPATATGSDNGSGPVSAQFSNNTSMSGGAMSVHTLLVDGTKTWSVSGGTFTFNTLDLASSNSLGGRLSMTGDATFAGLNGGAATITSSGQLVSSGRVDLLGGNRTFTVLDGAAEWDLSVNVPVLGAGRIVKAGAGTMIVHDYSGPTTVNAGTLILNQGAISGDAANNGTLVFEQSSASSYFWNISGSGTFIKRGTGQLTISNPSTMTGAVVVDHSSLLLSATGALASAGSYTVNGGTLSIDNSFGGNNNNRVSGGAITLNSGTLTFNGDSDGTTEAAGSLSAASGANTVSLFGSTNPSLIQFQSLSRSPGATITFNDSTSSSAGFDTFTDGAFIDQGTFFNFAGLHYAVWDSAGQPKAMVAGSGDSDYVNGMAANRHVRIFGAASPGTMSIYTLKLTGGVTVSAGSTLTMSKGGILAEGGNGTIDGGGAGAALAAPSDVEWVMNVSSSNNLTINIPVGGGSGLTKAGTGTLTLNGAGNYTGATAIGAGTVVAGPTNLNSERLILSGGGTLKTSAAFTTGRNVSLPGGTGVINTNGFDSNFYGDFSGAGAFTKTGSGTLTVNGPYATQSGPTSVTGGTLVAGAGNLGSGATSNYLYLNSATLKTLGSISTARAVWLDGTGGTIDTNGYDSSFSGVLSGAGGLTKTGAGTLVVSNAVNFYAGPTTLSGGTVVVSSPTNLGSESATLIFNGGRLRLADNLTTSRVLSFNSAGTIDTDGYAANLSSSIVGNGAMTKSGYGPMTLTAFNSYTGALTINNGTVRLTGASGAMSQASAFTVNAGGMLKLDNYSVNNGDRISNTAPITLNSGTIWVYGATGGTSESGGSLSSASGANLIVLTGSTPVTLALGTYTRSAGASLNFLNASTNLKTTFSGGVTAGSFIDQGTFVGSNYAVYDATGYVRAIASGAGDSDFVTTMTAGKHVKLGANATGVGTTSIYTVNLTNVNLGLSAGAVLTLSKGGILKTGTTENTISGGSGLTTSGGVELVANVVAGDDLLTISTPITAGSGLTKTGLGRLTLSGSNTYTGATTIAQGTLRVNNGANIPNTSTLVIGADAQLDLNNQNETVGGVTMYDGRVASGVGELNRPGIVGTLTLSGANPTVGYVGTGKGAFFSLASLAMGTSAGMTTFNIADGNAAADVTVYGNLVDGTGSHALTKSGAGNLVLAGSGNSFTGNVSVAAGTLTVDGALTSTSGTLDVPAGGTLAGSGTIAKPVQLSTGTINLSGGTINNSLTVVGATPGSWLGTGTVTGGTTVLGFTGVGVLTIGPNANLIASGGVTVNGTLNAAAASSMITGNVTYGATGAQAWLGNIAGAGKTLTINNNSLTLSLTGVNTFTGQTNVNNGILQLTRGDNLSGTSGVVQTMGGAGGTTGGTVQLTNNISVNVPLSLGGAGLNGSTGTPPGSIGALNNGSGTNSWAGNITLNGTGSSVGATLNQIGATAGTLVLNGVIQNGAGSSWGKTGNGDVVLSGPSGNTYTNQTLVFGGRLIIEKDAALGLSASDLNANGNTFLLTGGSATIAFRAPAASPGINYATNEWINLDGNGNGSLGQLDNLGGDNTFAGKIGIGGPTLSGEVTGSIGVSAGSLHLQGPIHTKGASGARTINKLGAGRLILSGDSGVAPTNSLNGSLSNSKVNVNAGTIELRSPTSTTTNLPGVTTWNVNAGGTVDISSGLLSTTTLNVNSSGLAKITNGSNAIRANAVNIAGGKIDVGRGKMIVDYTGASPLGSWNGSAYTDLTGQVETGRNGFAWDGASGIVTSETDATTTVLTTVAIADAFDVLGINLTETTTWRGQIVDGSSTLIAYTWGGDANLDGELNGDDYFRIDSNALAQVPGFSNGDFDYNGVITGDDYFIIDSNITYAQNSAPINSLTAVPEPAGIALVALGSATLLRRHRRRTQE